MSMSLFSRKSIQKPKTCRITLMSDIEKFNFIMNTEQLQPILSKVLTDMYRRRKEFL